MYVLGLQIEGPLLKVALLKRDNQKTDIELLRTFPLQENVKLSIHMLEPMLTGKKAIAVSGLEAWEALVRDLNLKLTKMRALKAALPFQIESLIAQPLNELIVLPFYYRHKSSTDIKLLTAPTLNVKNHLEKLDALGLQPDCVSFTSSALARLTQFLFPNQPDLFFFHLGRQRSTYGVVTQGKLSKSHSFNYGVSHFLQACAQDLPGKSEEELLNLTSATTANHPHLQQLRQQFQKELERAVAYLKSKTAADKVYPIFLTGAAIPFFNTRDLLEAAFPILTNPSFTAHDFAIPVGLALDGLAQDSEQVQFRQGPFTAPKTLQRRKRRGATYVLCCIALCLMTWLGGTLLLKQRERALAYQVNLHAQPKQAAAPLATAIAAWEKKLGEQKMTFSYFPSVPLVADVLAWLSAHPKLKDVDIKHVRYTLVKYPKVETPAEPYQAKVELEFIPPSPRAAREFHNALLAGDDIVNAKSEITWNVHQNVYKTSFFLNPNKRGG